MEVLVEQMCKLGCGGGCAMFKVEMGLSVVEEELCRLGSGGEVVVMIGW